MEKLPRRRYDYLRNPEEIYRLSFATVRAEAELGRIPPELHDLALRIVHATADASLVDGLRWSPRAAAAARRALADGAPVLVDCGMLAAGISRTSLPAANEVICTLDDSRVAPLAVQLGTTRSAASVELWRERLAGAIVAIGNAPTALFRLLEIVAEGASPPAAVLGFPVGFVGAAEAKAALAENQSGLEFVTLLGRRGGSAVAAAAVNALARASDAPS
jgi:precorrin-8X/cobalt-precorrin-8 methylmutase